MPVKYFLIFILSHELISAIETASPDSNKIMLDTNKISNVLLIENENSYLNKTLGIKINPFTFSTIMQSLELSLFFLNKYSEVSINYCSYCHYFYADKKIDLIYKYYVKKVQSGFHLNILGNFNWKEKLKNNYYGSGFGIGVTAFTEYGFYYGANLNFIYYVYSTFDLKNKKSLFFEFFRLGYAF
jgi:hypothetical protein